MSDERRPGAREMTFRRSDAAGGGRPVTRAVPVEAPVAIEINGLGYAVLMATPTELEDLAVGFLLSERLIDRPGDVVDLDVATVDGGVIARITLDAPHAARTADRVRHRVSDSSCGLCGIENLEQALRPLPPVVDRCLAGDAAVFASLAALGATQALNRATGAVHAAAMCAADGAIRLVREDVGRHNAFDKLIGAMLAAGLGWDGGYALLTSRCSYELVEKAVLAGCPMLVTISAPTTLAVERAAAAGLALKVLARSDSYLDLEES